MSKDGMSTGSLRKGYEGPSPLGDTPGDCLFDDDPEQPDSDRESGLWVCLDCGERKPADDMRTVVPDMVAETGEAVGSCKECHV